MNNCRDDTVAHFLVDQCVMTYTCDLLKPDINYYSICCNSDAADDIVGTDPITNLPFSFAMCTDYWCSVDPLGSCSAIFDTCNGTSSCHRHWFLSTETKYSPDIMLQNLKIIGGPDDQTPIKGNMCNRWYDTTKLQATYQFAIPSTFSYVVKDRVRHTMEMIGEFCNEPLTNGNGECSCLRGIYGVAGALAEQSPDAITRHLASIPPENYPTIVQASGDGTYRRMDGTCLFSGTTDYWTRQLSLTVDGETYSISNLCSRSDTWSSFDFNSAFPTFNPNDSIRSLSHGGNFGSIAGSQQYNQSILDLEASDNQNPFAMPLHCWLPSCIGADELVFRDMNLFTVTCPDICYMYSDGNSIDIGGLTSSTYVNVSNDIQLCPGQYSSVPNPFDVSCPYIDIQAPINFSDTLYILIQNNTHEMSGKYVSKSCVGYTNISPLLSFGGSSSFDLGYVYKYSISQADDPALQNKPDLLTLSVTLDTHFFKPSVYDSQIVLSDKQKHSMAIPVRITLYPEGFVPIACAGTDSNGNCVACSNDFGENAGLGTTFSDLPTIVRVVDGVPLFRPLENVSPFQDPIQVTENYLLQNGSAYKLLQSHIQLYGR